MPPQIGPFVDAIIQFLCYQDSRPRIQMRTNFRYRIQKRSRLAKQPCRRIIV